MASQNADQDVGFPYMLSSRLPPDTLFLYFESDFRFHKCDCLEPDAWLRFIDRRREFLRDSVAACEAEVDSGDEPVAAAASFGSTKPWRRPTPQEYECTAELCDSVRVCTLAHRCKDAAGNQKGDLVWLSWNAGHPGEAGIGHNARKKYKKIQYGWQAIAFTKRSAGFMYQQMIKTERAEHFDLWLKRAVREYPESSYVNPPIGGYSAHRSANLKGRVRKSSFDEPWALPGSGRERRANGRPRELLAFSPQEGEWLCDLELPEDKSALWKTSRPPAYEPRGPSSCCASCRTTCSGSRRRAGGGDHGRDVLTAIQSHGRD